MPPRTRRQIASPAGMLIPSPLATPSILRQILLHCPNDTLARCMRVAHHFYNVAGPILYHEIRYPGICISQLVEGYNVPTRARATRATKASFNLKTQLLDRIRIVEVSLHDRCLFPKEILPLIPRLRTLRFATPWWIDHTPLYDYLLREIGCTCGTVQPYTCPVWRHLRADKTVLSLDRGCTVDWMFPALETLIHEAKVVAIVISPVTVCCTGWVAETLRQTLDKVPERVTLRVLFAPPSTRLATVSNHSRSRPPVGSPSSAADVIDFCRKIVSARFSTTIYLIQGHSHDLLPPWSHSDAPLGVLPLADDVRRALQPAPGVKADGIPIFDIKSRADYLSEGVRDEIDPEQLDEWRESERLASREHPEDSSE